jgi:hypothetical protein|tara:strand:+ start:2473 stop:3039 length:567 start_codon:yes stop_codon:yes gene_type:complete
MSATAAPNGLQAVNHPSGTVRPTVLRDGILSTYGTAILQNQAVKLQTAGVIQAAAAGDSFIGTFIGVMYTGTDGRPVVSNQWTASTAYIAGTCQAFFTQDPTISYHIETDGTVAQALIGAQVDISNAADGSTTTGLSAQTCSATASGGTGQLRVLGKADLPDNEWGDAFVVLRVQPAEHQYVATIAEI